MVSSESQRELTGPCMSPNCFRNGLGDFRYKPWILQLAQRRIRGSGYLLKLVVAVELDFPPQVPKLVCQACIYEMNGTMVDAAARLVRVSIGIKTIEIDR
jgi:hypothetical protein